MRRAFPLDAKTMDNLVRPERLHVTLQSLEIFPVAGAEAAPDIGELLASAVEDHNLQAFTVQSSDLGCFWRAAGSGWGRTPRVVWLGLRDVEPLVALQQTLASALHQHGVAPSTRKFCAHVTLGKTKGSEGMNSGQRRALRTLGKWMQDRSRSVGLQKTLQEGGGRSSADGAKGSGGGAREGGSGRGARRLKSWEQSGVAHGARVSSKALTGMVSAYSRAYSGKEKQMENKRERKQGRDLGGLNAALAADDALGWDEEAPEEDQREEHKEWGVGGGTVPSIAIRVESLQVMEAIPVEGTRQVVYK
ncbi:hypothetical protein T484DRAFT_1824779, partial [Baffinella frigidus]